MLDEMKDIRASRGFQFGAELLPGCSGTEVRKFFQSAGLPEPVPDELVELYAWSCGSLRPAHMFRHFRLTPLIEVQRSILRVRELYASQTEFADAPAPLCDLLPFADHESGWLSVALRLSKSGSTGRPVIEIGEGIDVVFDSLNALIRTCLEWYRFGFHDAIGVWLDRDTELRIWSSFNKSLHPIG